MTTHLWTKQKHRSFSYIRHALHLYLKFYVHRWQPISQLLHQMSLLNAVTSMSHKMKLFNIKKICAITYSAAQFKPRIQMKWFRVQIRQCSLLTIFFFWQRKAWHSRVSLNWLWETYAKTLSWVLSAVQYEILKRKTQEHFFFWWHVTYLINFFSPHAEQSRAWRVH